jgi:hypothetical protein
MNKKWSEIALFHRIGFGADLTCVKLKALLLLTVATPLFAACGAGGFKSFKFSASPSEQAVPSAPEPLSESAIELDGRGEEFQAKISAGLEASHYMEGDCTEIGNWPGWEGLPLERCRYSTNGQTAEVVMLNPGPRRLTAWLENACRDLADDFENCLTKTYQNILNQSGAQFPVAGIVIEDMDGNGHGNVYAFRDGVTVKVSLFTTGSEALLAETQIQEALWAPPLHTYTYARPSSTTREQLATYGGAANLKLPSLAQTEEQSNAFHQTVGDLYRQAWFGSTNHVIRAWVAAQGF